MEKTTHPPLARRSAAPALAAAPGAAPVPAAPVPAIVDEPRWTRKRMADFLYGLAASRNVAEAARQVGMSRPSAYKLRARNRGKYFDIAWSLAMRENYEGLHAAAIERATNGVEVPVYHKGELVATRQQFDERLTCFLLSARNKQASSPTREEYDRLQYWADKLPELITRVEKSGELPSEED